MRWPSRNSSLRSARRSAPAATLQFFADADHSFHVPARTGRKDAEVLADVLDAFSAWVGRLEGQTLGMSGRLP